MLDAIYSFDLSVFSALDRLHTPLLDGFMRFVTLFGEGGYFWIVLALVLLVFKRTRTAGLALAATLIVFLVVNDVALKNIVARPRPYVKYDIEALIAFPSGYSFPSGHTGCCFAGAASLALTLRRERPLGVGMRSTAAGWVTAAAYVIAALCGLSRIWLHVHYCTDVLGGIVSGTFCGLAGSALALLAAREYLRRKPMPIKE